MPVLDWILHAAAAIILSPFVAALYLLTLLYDHFWLLLAIDFAVFGLLGLGYLAIFLYGKLTKRA